MEELKGSAADVLVPDPRGHLPNPCGVRPLMGQNCSCRWCTHMCIDGTADTRTLPDANLLIVVIVQSTKMNVIQVLE